ncbi:MAG: creatininase family protein [Methanobacteriota archaeon]|nr:MAG: creatininase family protein [Euryarchaeota archaeon]
MVGDTSARRGGRKLNIDELTSEDFSAIVKRNPIAILPMGAVEEHGSHLPLGTDSFQCEEVVNRLAKEFGALVLPPIRYGDCRSTRNFPGTISLSFETLQAVVMDVLSELARNGISRVVVLSGHAGSGHMASLKLAAQRVAERHANMKIMVLSDYDIAYDLAGKEFPETDGHAGQIETSRMLAIRPDLVGAERPCGDSRPPRYMIVNDPERCFPSGVMGDSRDASAEKGKRIDDYIFTELSRIMTEDFGAQREKGDTSASDIGKEEESHGH